VMNGAESINLGVINDPTLVAATNPWDDSKFGIRVRLQIHTAPFFLHQL